MPTAGNPVVYGRWHAGDRLPTVLVYGHYYVQPVDPLNEWTSPPFDPAVRDDRLFARGASDDNGALFVVLAALDALGEAGGKPPVNLKFMVEGEEEVGSPNLLPFIREHRGLLDADMTMSADGSMLGADTPSVSVGNRGLAGVQINVRGARTDLHSGTYGGAYYAPLFFHLLPFVEQKAVWSMATNLDYGAAVAAIAIESVARAATNKPEF